MTENKVKIGSRILSKSEISKLLPNNNDIYNKIDKIKETANSYNTEVNELAKRIDPINKDHEFYRHFNNIFSVLGERGSGKTSVLLTIKYKLMKENKDIVLPLIVPEKMGEVSDIVGSLLGVFGDIVNDTCNEIFKLNYKYEGNVQELNNYFEGCRYKDNNPLKKSYTEVLKQYRYTKVDYREILIKEYVGFNDYINMTRNMIDSDQKLILAFEEFINELVKIKQVVGRLEKQPLVIAFFDDIDLRPDRCTELVNVLLRYLSNINIVVFISGNKTTFAEALTIDMLNIKNISHKQMMVSYLPLDIESKEINLLDSRKILVQDILKKAMPPTLRYEIPFKDDRDRADFRFCTKDDNSEEEYLTLKDLIVSKFIGEKNDFLTYKNEVIYPYFKIIDSTARGAMNVYYFLHNLNDEASDVENIKMFINVLVSSSKILSKYQNHIRRIIDIRDNIEDTFIDYEYIKTIQNVLKDDNIMPVEEAITLFMLANFIENIVCIKINKNNSISRKSHGENVLSQILNKYNEQLKIYPDINDINFILKLYTNISESISEYNISKVNDQYEKNHFLNIYFKILEKTIKESKYETIGEFFKHIKYKDEKWVDEKIDIIMKYNNDIEVITCRNINKEFNILSMKSIILDDESYNQIKQDLDKIKSKIINDENKLRTKNVYEYYTDSLFYEKEKILKLNYIYEFNDEFIEKSNEILNNIGNNIGEEYRYMLKNAINENFIENDEYCRMKNYLETCKYTNKEMNFSKKEHNNISQLYILLKNLKKQIINKHDGIDYYSIIEKIMDDFENIIRIDVKNDIEYNKKEDNFYEVFNSIRKSLMVGINRSNYQYKGFKLYVQNKEKEAKEVNINV